VLIPTKRFVLGDGLPETTLPPPPSSTGVLDQVGDGFHSTNIHKDYIASLKIADVFLAWA